MNSTDFRGLTGPLSTALDARRRPMARGGHAVNSRKHTKAAAKYQPVASMPEHHCGVCRHFKAPHGCEVVDGDISPRGWCRFFSAMKAPHLTVVIAPPPQIHPVVGALMRALVLHHMRRHQQQRGALQQAATRGRV